MLIWTGKPDQAAKDNRLTTQAQPEILGHRPEVILYVANQGAYYYNHQKLRKKKLLDNVLLPLEE